MNTQLLKHTIAQVIHLTPARQAEICYTVAIADYNDTTVSVTLTPSLAHLTGTRIGNRNVNDLYASMVLHTGLALGNLSELLDQAGLTYTVDRYFPTDRISGNTNAKSLLESNIEFIAAETAAWIAHQCSEQQGVFKQYQYDSDKCHRDLRFVLSAVAQDLEHMTNQHVLSVLKEYFDRSGKALVRQHVEVAAYHFVQNLVEHVMTLRRPLQQYQTQIQQKLAMPLAELDYVKWTNDLLSVIITVLDRGIDHLPCEITSANQQNYIKVLVNV